MHILYELNYPFLNVTNVVLYINFNKCLELSYDFHSLPDFCSLCKSCQMFPPYSPNN